MKQQANWKKRIIVLSVLVVLALASVTLCRAYSSALSYRMGSMTEHLKAQLEQEHEVYSSTLFESIDIDRPSKYSFDAEDWVFRVVLSDDPTEYFYVYSSAEREFILQ